MSSAAKPEDIVCIVLAAGSSKRFGSDKRIAALPDGNTVLNATLNSIPPIFARQLIVLQSQDDCQKLQLPNQWRAVIANDAEHGMGRSLVAGIKAAGECQAVLVVLADMPHLLPTTYLAITQALKADRLVVPRYQQQRGNPVGIGANYFDELKQLQGDQGARVLMQQNPNAIFWLDCLDEGILRDIDKPEDIAQG